MYVTLFLDENKTGKVELQVVTDKRVNVMTKDKNN